MIKNTFLILDGIGEKTERLLWEKGILSWEDFLSAGKLPRSITNRRRLYEEMLTYFSYELKRYNEKPFVEFINKSDHWRLYRHFKDYSLCIDIETNGLPARAGGEITVIGFYDGINFRQYVKGVNLNEECIFRELSSCKMLISFYGSVFDIPFLKRNFVSLRNIEIPHFDLCFASRRAGFSGGLKRIETILGIKRDGAINNLNGFDAVKLWQSWKQGDNEALNKLLFYNKADTVNLMKIADIVYNKLHSQSGFNRYYEKYYNR